MDSPDEPAGGAGTPLQPLTAALLEAVASAEVAAVVVKRGTEILGAQAGLVALVTRDGRELEIAGTSGCALDALQQGNHLLLDGPSPLYDVARGGGAVYLGDRADWAVKYPTLSGEITSQASVSLPLAARQRVFGVLHFSFVEARGFTASDRSLLSALARQCALALERALLLEEVDAARASAEAARVQQEFLARAGALLGESLDYPSRLEALARLCVPELADWAAVDVLGDDDRLVRLAVAHRRPDREEPMREVERRYPLDAQRGPNTFTVILTGERLFYPDIPPEVIDAAAEDAEHAHLLKRIGVRAGLCLPISARGRTQGALTLGMGPEPEGSGRVFTAGAVALAEEVARLAAVAVENALLFRAAEAAQQRAEAVLESMGEMFFALDTAWRFTYVNHHAEAQWAKSRADLLGRSAWDVFPEARGSAIQHHFERAVRDKVAVEFEIDLGPRLGWFEVRAYPSPMGVSVYFRNIAERKTAEAERQRAHAEMERAATERARLVGELREANVRQRRFLREMLRGFTDGRLHLCDTKDDLPAPLPPLSDEVELTPTSLRLLRKQVEAVAEGLRLPKERLHDLATAVHEAGMNAVRHGGGGTSRVHGDSETGIVQVWVSDRGPGIAEEMIHRAVEQGFTTGGFGHGFYLMRSCADRVYLLTGPGGTTAVIEQARTTPEPAWLQRGE